MKRLILFLVLLPSFLIGQDIIIKKNADEIKAKVVEVGMDNIKYKNFDNLQGPSYVIPRVEVFMIRYENGKRDVFKDEVQQQTKENPKNKKSIEELIEKKTSSEVGDKEIKEKFFSIEKNELDFERLKQFDKAEIQFNYSNEIRILSIENSCSCLTIKDFKNQQGDGIISVSYDTSRKGIINKKFTLLTNKGDFVFYIKGEVII